MGGGILELPKTKKEEKTQLPYDKTEYKRLMDLVKKENPSLNDFFAHVGVVSELLNIKPDPSRQVNTFNESIFIGIS